MSCEYFGLFRPLTPLRVALGFIVVMSALTTLQKKSVTIALAVLSIYAVDFAINAGMDSTNKSLFDIT